jgi:hypothetical protein
MSINTPITKENLNEYLKELAKEYRRRSGKAIPAEIILIGGAAVLASYGFRDLTYDSEREAKEILLDFDKKYPDALGADNISDIIAQARQKQRENKIDELS